MINNTKIVIPTRLEWLSLLAVIGILGFLAQVNGFEANHFVTLRANDIQILLTMGLQRETASRGSLAVYSKIVFATMLERILFHTLPAYLSVVGTLMILVSALYIAVRSCPPHITCTMSSLTRMNLKC